MRELAQMKCVPCSGGVPPLSEIEIRELCPLVPEWELIEADGMPRLNRRYRFKDFAAAMAFSNKVGEIAEIEDHHPAILIEYGATTITWWTHSIQGLHRNDFIMAARTDQLYEEEIT
jgi:4a-hydroxytetrahydrobiopterin dehydratase